MPSCWTQGGGRCLGPVSGCTPRRKSWDIYYQPQLGWSSFRFLKQSTVQQQYITFRKSLDDQKSWGWLFFLGRKFFPMDSEFPTQKVFLVQHQVEHDVKHISLSSWEHKLSYNSTSQRNRPRGLWTIRICMVDVCSLVTVVAPQRKKPINHWSSSLVLKGLPTYTIFISSEYVFKAFCTIGQGVFLNAFTRKKTSKQLIKQKWERTHPPNIDWMDFSFWASIILVISGSTGRI